MAFSLFGEAGFRIAAIVSVYDASIYFSRVMLLAWRCCDIGAGDAGEANAAQAPALPRLARGYRQSGFSGFGWRFDGGVGEQPGGGIAAAPWIAQPLVAAATVGECR